jgi:hypothetical protein
MTGADLPRGAVMLRLHLFHPPGEEIADALHPPWPQWMRRLYGLERLGSDTDPEEGEVSLSAAVAAVATRIKHRLDLVSWCVAALEEIGWEVAMDGDDVIATKVTLPELAREELEEHGIYGPVTKVCDIDEHGLPRIVERWETV